MTMIEEELDSALLEDDEPEKIRKLEIPFVARAAIEHSLRQRKRYTPELRHLSYATLERLDAMFERLSHHTSQEQAEKCILGSFTSENERRAALVPMLAVLYPLGFFDEHTPTELIARLVARAQGFVQ
jgi:hypothetical protein